MLNCAVRCYFKGKNVSRLSCFTFTNLQFEQKSKMKCTRETMFFCLNWSEQWKHIQRNKNKALHNYVTWRSVKLHLHFTQFLSLSEVSLIDNQLHSSPRSNHNQLNLWPWILQVPPQTEGHGCSCGKYCHTSIFHESLWEVKMQKKLRAWFI